jgi:transposase
LGGGRRDDGRAAQEALFYEFSLERHVPADHWARAVDRFVDLSDIRAHLRPFYSEMGRPSIDPELMIRMLLVGYCFGIRSERRLCEEVHLNRAYRWFVDLASKAMFPTTRPSRRTVMVASATAIFCASCSRRPSGAALPKVS